MKLKILLLLTLASMFLMKPTNLLADQSNLEKTKPSKHLNDYLTGIENVEIPPESEPLLLYPEQIDFVLQKYGEEVAAETRKAVLLEKEPEIEYWKSKTNSYEKESIRLTKEVHTLQWVLGGSIVLNVLAGGFSIVFIISK